MNKTTPRKSRHRHHPSSGTITRAAAAAAISDYESDAAAHYIDYSGAEAVPPLPADLPQRTNTELNLSVLRRYQPDVRAIVSIAANAVVYAFSAASQGWDKTGAEGTLFVCEREPLWVAAASAGGGEEARAFPQACVFILNRRGLDNVIVDLARVSHCEITPELTIFKMDEDGSPAGGGVGDPENGNGASQVVGVWLHADEDDTRETNAAIIQNLWSQVRAAAEDLEMAQQTEPGKQGAAIAAAPGRGYDTSATGAAAAAQQETGKRISLSQLFGQGGGGGAGLDM